MIMLALLSLLLTASAQKQKSTTIDFNVVTLEAGSNKPTIGRFNERVEKKFESMIPMRISFENELFKSTDALK